MMNPSAPARNLDLPRYRILDVGCGGRKFRIDAVGLDLVAHPGVDLVGDALESLKTFDDQSVDGVYCSHLLEHLTDPELVLFEMTRVLRVGGLMEIRVPHFANPYFYSDPTHKTFFGLYTLEYLGIASPSKRSVPQGLSLPLDTVRRRLRFKSDPAFPVRRVIKQAIEGITNLTLGTQEFHEEALPWIIPPYEIQWLLKRNAGRLPSFEQWRSLG